MFLEYQRMGSEAGSESRIRTISGVSQDSQFLASANGELHTEEKAPSTVIELRVDEQATDETTDNEEMQTQMPVTVSNILVRDEEESQTAIVATSAETQDRDKDEQDTVKEPEKDNEIKDLDDNHKTEANMDEDREQMENVKTEGSEGKKESSNLSVKDEADSAQTETDKNAKDETEAVKMPDEGKTNNAENEQNVQVEDEKKDLGDSSLEAVKEDSSVVLVHEETSTTGASVVNEDSTDVSSASNFAKVSDDSTEDSATTGETDDHGVEKEDGGKEKENKSETDKDEKLMENEKTVGIQDSPAPMVEVDLNQSSSPDDTKPQTDGHGDVEAEKTTKEQKSKAEVSPSAESISQDAANNQDSPKAAGTDISANKTKEIKIARLDVSSVASDTERLELKDTSATVSSA